jgi:hypothetical protein
MWDLLMVVLHLSGRKFNQCGRNAPPAALTPTRVETRRVGLRDLGFQPDQPTEHQLKIGDANYYAGRGTVFVDGEIARRDETGRDRR